MSVIIIADREDLHADCIAGRLRENETSVVRLSPVHDFSRPYSFKSSSPRSVRLGGRVFNIDEISGVYCRVALERLIECFSPRNAVERYCIEEEASAWLSALLLLPDKIWMNNPRHDLWSDVKSSSLMQAIEVGLNVPEFLITNSLTEAQNFSAGRDVVVKPISDASFALQNSNYVSVPDFGEFESVGTRFFDPNAVNSMKLDGTPFLLQAYIPRHEEYRVTIVESCVFAAVANVPDFRIDIKDAAFPIYSRCQLPELEAIKLIELTRALHLRVCTFDILKSTSGSLFLVDINPNGNWLWLDREFDGLISKTIGHALTFSPAAEARAS